MRTRGIVNRVKLALLAALVCAPAAHAAFPYAPQGAPTEYDRYRLPAGANQTPNDLTDKRVWMYAATAHPDASPLMLADKRELNGVRGAHVADAQDVDQAWRTTTGRPDVTIAVLDSGIKWNDAGGMVDIRSKTRISRGETPVPQADRATATEPGQVCAQFAAAPGQDARDLNRDGVFNIVDYACDARVSVDPAQGAGLPDTLDPQDVLIAFTDFDDDDGNGYEDDIVGWDFLDDDNDPFDDVQYGHGTGEARDSAGEADNGGDLGTCPNCMEIHLRVGTSFIADVNRFALAVLYATDNGVLVVQEALGTLNKSRVGADAVKYAYDHGVVVIASAADEAAQHHNWPSSYPYAIVVNSVTNFNVLDEVPWEAFPPPFDQLEPPEEVKSPAKGSHLMFNGCTNFSSRITLAIPSVSCSSDATGRGAGMAGLVYAAALNAIAQGRMQSHPTCVRTNGQPCPVSANEVRQLMASGTVDGIELVDDVNFSTDPILGTSLELSCTPIPAPACTDPFAPAPNSRVTAPRSYPARLGHDQFYGYGRVNMNKAVDALVPPGTGTPASRIPPEVEVTSPQWYDTLDPAGELLVEGHAFARGESFRCAVYVAAGSYPNDASDFVAMPSPVCNSSTPHTARVEGELARVSMADVRALFPATAGDFTGREPGTGDQPWSGRPNSEPYVFVVKVVATAAGTTGEDR